MSWVDQANQTPSVEVATRLGFEPRRHASSSSCRCPACGAERRHTKSRDRRGAVGMPHGHPGWRCWQCDASGDAIDFAACHIGGARFRDLDSARKDEVKAFFGFAEDYRVTAPAIPRRATQAANVASENAETNYPSLSEVESLWEASRPVSDDAAVLAYLAHRGIGPVSVLVDHDCVRALPEGARVPAWARFRGEPWSATGHRMIVPLYDYQGQLRSVLARSVERDPVVKSVGVTGYGRRGLVMAGSYGREVLAHGAQAHWHRLTRLRVTVYEGEIDTLRAIAAGEDAELSEDYQACGWRVVFGIFSGSFTRDVASRIPSGSTVVLATDDDEPGDKYAEEIRERIGDRCDYERVRTANDSPTKESAE